MKAKNEAYKSLTETERNLIFDIHCCCYNQLKKFGLKHCIKKLGYPILSLNIEAILNYLNLERQYNLKRYKASIFKLVFEVSPNRETWKHIYLTSSLKDKLSPYSIYSKI